MIYGDNDMKEFILKHLGGITSSSRFAYLPKDIFEVEDITALDVAVLSTIAVHSICVHEQYVYNGTNPRVIMGLLGMTNHSNGKNLAKINSTIRRLVSFGLLDVEDGFASGMYNYTLKVGDKKHFALLPIDGYYAIVNYGSKASHIISLLSIYASIVSGIYQPIKLRGAKEQYVDPYKPCMNYRSSATIGKCVGMVRQTAVKYIDELVKLGVIVRVRTNIDGAKNMITYLSTKEFAQYMYKSLLFKIDNLTVIGIYPEK
jgi:hypothetical protein